MKKTLFVVSHHGADSHILCDILDKNSRIQAFHTGLIYSSPEVMLQLTNLDHKLDNAAAIWMDDLLENYRFCHKAIYGMAKFIYLIRNPRGTFENLAVNGKITTSEVLRYTYRLRRICEMARRTPGGILMQWEDMQSGSAFPIIEEYLNLKQPLEQSEDYPSSNTDDFTHQQLDYAQKRYEWYLFYLKQLKLKRIERDGSFIT